MDTSTLHQLPNDEKLRIFFELWDDLASQMAPWGTSETEFATMK